VIYFVYLEMVVMLIDMCFTAVVLRLCCNRWDSFRKCEQF